MKKTILFLAFITAISSCKKEKEFEETKGPVARDVSISNNVKVVDDATNTLLTYLDTNKVVFSAATAYLTNLQVGDVIVSGIHANAPEGYLGEVTAINITAGVVEVTTVKSDLSSIVLDGGFSFEQELEPDNVRSSGFTKNINEVLYDRDGNTATTNDQVKLVGSVNIKPTMILDADWSGLFTLDKLKMGIKVTQTDDFRLTGNVDLPSNYTFEKELYRQQLKPIQFTLGYVPVVINPIVVIKAGVDGDANISFNVTYDDSHTLTAYVEKPSGVNVTDFNNWNRHFSTNTDYQNFNPNDIPSNMNNINVDLDIPYVWGGVEFYLYNYSGARSQLYARAAIDVQAACNFSNTCEASIDLTLRACITAYLKIFRKTYVDNEFCFLDKRYPIWSYSNASLVAHYPLDGNGNDVSGNNLHGVVNNLGTTSDRDGNPGSAMLFNGASSDLTINHELLSSSSNTITFWAKPTYSYNSAGSHYFFDAVTPTAPTDRYLLYKNESVGLTDYAGGANLGSLTRTSPSWWNTNQWMHFAITYDESSNESKLYIDGQYIYTFASTWSSKNPTTFFLGKRHTPFTGIDYERFSGIMDDLRVYSDALSYTKIKEIYNN